MPRWEGREAYKAEQRRLRDLETGGARASGGPTLGVHIDSGVAGECGPESVGGTGGQPHGDDVDRGEDSDSPNDGDRGEAAKEDLVERVIVGLRTTDMEGGMPGGRDTSLMGDVVMAEEVGLHTDRQGSDTRAGRSPVMEEGVDADEEAQSSPPRIQRETCPSCSFDVRGDEAATVFGGGSTRDMHPPRPPSVHSSPLYKSSGSRAAISVASASHGASGDGWSSYKRVTDRLRRDCERGQGFFARGSTAGADVGDASIADLRRPSVHTAARILGLPERQTRRLEVFPTPGAVDDRRRGLPYTSGKQGRDVTDPSVAWRLRLLVVYHMLALKMEVPLWYVGVYIHDRPEDDDMDALQESMVLCLASCFQDALRGGQWSEKWKMSLSRLNRIGDAFRLLLAANMWIMRMGGDNARSHYEASYYSQLVTKLTQMAVGAQTFNWRRHIVDSTNVVLYRLGKPPTQERPTYIPEWAACGISFNCNAGLADPGVEARMDWLGTGSLDDETKDDGDNGDGGS
ncbi:hypothetical protein CBR_g17878 [Chara braunii]|uniref:Uncharacterized protein n=1 Tax=Chara braunii TaxID=69332 RepID=A0A388KVS3_CHABU|nr:hypothetical protein CBR_g17878 [Chara braunii]|eukprot:GBG74165.1 hypothetical protein CBR_g17878 [Chara braunii]